MNYQNMFPTATRASADFLNNRMRSILCIPIIGGDFMIHQSQHSFPGVLNFLLLLLWQRAISLLEHRQILKITFLHCNNHNSQRGTLKRLYYGVSGYIILLLHSALIVLTYICKCKKFLEFSSCKTYQPYN